MKLVSNFGMSNSLQESNRGRIEQYQDAIRRHWGVGGNFKNEQFVDLSPHGQGWVSAFDLIGSPKQHTGAKQCFVWEGKDFQKDEKEAVTILDVQVASDSDKLPLMAVFAWLFDFLIKNPDIYVESKKWSKDQLNNEAVEFGFPLVPWGSPNEIGRFFVRERADGKIAVRILKELQKELNGKLEFINDSFCLDLPSVEKIERPSNADYFTLH